MKKVDENTSGAVLATYQYHYDGSEVAVEYQPSTTWTYYLGPGIDQVVMRTNGTAKQWYYRDGQGSISAVADNSGNVLEQYEYNAQGQFQITSGAGTVLTSTAIANDILYTGRSYDTETGNYFYRARYYSPVLGRFISRDPLSGAEFSQGTNLYAYCGNNFLNASDPTGMCGKLLDDVGSFLLDASESLLETVGSGISNGISVSLQGVDVASEGQMGPGLSKATNAVFDAVEDVNKASNGLATTGPLENQFDDLAAAEFDAGTETGVNAVNDFNNIVQDVGNMLNGPSSQSSSPLSGIQSNNSGPTSTSNYNLTPDGRRQ